VKVKYVDSVSSSLINFDDRTFSIFTILHICNYFAVIVVLFLIINSVLVKFLLSYFDELRLLYSKVVEL
jgi:hypothetical protein